jgi:hypothetical protein
MATLSDMRSRIADDLDRSDLSTQIDKAINRAIEHYERQRFWFNEKIATFNTVANQKNYGSADGIPTDLAEIDYVEVTVSGKEYKLTPRTYPYIRELIGYDMTGQPYDYCYYQENFYFYLIPNAVYTITVSYQQKYTALSADADTNDFTTDAEDLIEARARKWLYARVIKDQEQAQIADLEEREALAALREKTDKLIGTGFVRPTCF